MLKKHRPWEILYKWSKQFRYTCWNQLFVFSFYFMLPLNCLQLFSERAESWPIRCHNTKSPWLPWQHQAQQSAEFLRWAWVGPVPGGQSPGSIPGSHWSLPSHKEVSHKGILSPFITEVILSNLRSKTN